MRGNKWKKARIIKHPLDFTKLRIPIEGFNVGDIVWCREKENGKFDVDGTIHYFDKDSLELI